MTVSDWQAPVLNLGKNRSPELRTVEREFSVTIDRLQSDVGLFAVWTT